MKYTTVLVAIFASAVAAGAIEERGGDNKPPKCAKKCIKETYKISGCGKKDYKCMCTSQPFHKAVVPCIKDHCGKGEMYASLPSPAPALLSEPARLTTLTVRRWPTGSRRPAASSSMRRRVARSKRLERRPFASLLPGKLDRGRLSSGAVEALPRQLLARSGYLVFLGVEGRLLSR